MAPLRGWGLKGKPLRGFAPHGHWRTLTFLGSARCPLRLRRADQRPVLPRLCRAATRARARTRRHRHHGQSRIPQIGRRPATHPRSRSKAPVPAALLARPQPDRAGLRQDQALDENRPEANRRRDLATRWPTRRDHRTSRVRQLLRKRRIRFPQNVNGPRAFHAVSKQFCLFACEVIRQEFGMGRPAGYAQVRRGRPLAGNPTRSIRPPNPPSFGATDGSPRPSPNPSTLDRNVSGRRISRPLEKL
jgi:hypothetical protein